MLVFIDESGDPGMKLEEGSSLYFTVALVAFQDREEANAVDQRIGLLRRELRFADNFEFHFNKLRGDLRERFLEAVAPYEFLYFGIVINKTKLTGPGFQFRDSFYKYTCSLVFENAKPHLDGATVVIDGSGSEKFRQQLATYLRRRVNDPTAPSRAIRKVKIQDSRRNNLLQLADMVCGALARSYGGKSDAESYRRIIRHREYSVQFWPK
jgi:hypothetical protein